MNSDPTHDRRKLFWISWYQPTGDHRPLHSPPYRSVLGWWCTGWRCSDDASTLCALVRANNKAGAKCTIRKDWPEAREWRFCKETDSLHLSDRFPLSDWMKERFEEAWIDLNA